MKKLFLLFILLISLKGTAQQQPIFATISGGDLYSFDVANCTRHFIGSTGYGFGDIAFTDDGRLWGIINGLLYQIDTATANATLVGTMGASGVSLVGLNDSILLMEAGMNLYAIDVSDASTHYIDTIGYAAAGDLTWYDDDLYMVTSGGQIIRMVLNNSSTALLSVTAIGSSIPTCEGAATASFAGDYNSIIGFNGPNLIKICQLNGDTTMLCPALNLAGTPGAASIRLLTQDPQPTVCSILTSASEQIAPPIRTEIFPNPSADQIFVQTSYAGGFDFMIYNAMGQVVRTGVTQTAQAVVNVYDLPSGIYTIRLVTEDAIEQKLFSVER